MVVTSEHVSEWFNHYLLFENNSRLVVFFMLLKFSLNEFKADREYRNISNRTIESYMGTLNEFHVMGNCP